MQDDHDIFAVLTADDKKNKASSAFKLWHNSAWFVPASGGIAEKATIGSREATPAQDPQRDENICTADRLVVTFSELMQLEGLGKGILAGTSFITVDDNLHIWLHDHSSHGTAVGYQGQNEDETRRTETWILAYEPGRRGPFGNITINTGGLIVTIEFPSHWAGDPPYVALLRALVDKCKAEADVPNVQELGLASRVSTQAPSGAQTIGERTLYYREKKIGRGQFAQVYKIIRARDGKVLAAKTFTPPISKNKRKRDEVDPEWFMMIRREFAIINENRHPNIIQVFEHQESPENMIVMAYYPLGSMVDARVVDKSMCLTSFGQVLDCLAYLHRRDIAHRDLKPENFLVELEPFYKVVVADFGLSKVAAGDAWLTTFCGTLAYTSPEVFPFNTDGHGPPADIWSLGVIGLEWKAGIPEPPEKPTAAPGRAVTPRRWHTWVDDWVDRLLQRLSDEHDGDDPMFEILGHMLQRDDRKRWHAAECLALGLENGLFERRACDGLIAYKEPKTPTRASSSQPALADSDSNASTDIMENMWEV